MDSTESKRVKLEPEQGYGYDYLTDILPAERFKIFKENYPELSGQFSYSSDLFQKSCEELSKEEANEYFEYFRSLSKLENEKSKLDNERKLEDERFRIEMEKLKVIRREMEIEYEINVNKQKKELETEVEFEKKLNPAEKMIWNRFKAVHKPVLNQNIYKIWDVLSEYISIIYSDSADSVRKLLDQEQKLKVSGLILMNLVPSIALADYLYGIFGVETVLAPSVNPCDMNAKVQRDAQLEGKNLIYPFPFEIKTNFPITACHEIFSDFIEILNCDLTFATKNLDHLRPSVKKYFKFLNELPVELFGTIENSVNELIEVFLASYSSEIESSEVSKEASYVQKVCSVLRPIFSTHGAIQTQASIGASGTKSRTKIDLGIFISDFPFIIFEAKWMNLSANATLQAIQYYARNVVPFVSEKNKPAFLIVFDRLFMHVYGTATVQGRTVTDCLMSLEFSNYHCNLNGFLDKLFRCITSIYYFYENLKKSSSSSYAFAFEEEAKTKTCVPLYSQEKIGSKKRNQNQSTSSLSLKVNSNLDSSLSPALILPEFLSIDPWSDHNDQNEIDVESPKILLAFERQEQKNANVFRVKYGFEGQEEEGESHPFFGILKIAYNYGLSAHVCLASKNMAPTIIGYKYVENGNYGRLHFILMEDLERSEFKYMPLINYCRLPKDYNLRPMFDSLETFLESVHNNGMVHGDFRNNNIFIKLIATTNPELYDFDFKLIDFEFSGQIDSLYPCLVRRNRNINWHQCFQTYKPRLCTHDIHMFSQMKLASGYY